MSDDKNEGDCVEKTPTVHLYKEHEEVSNQVNEEDNESEFVDFNDQDSEFGDFEDFDDKQTKEQTTIHDSPMTLDEIYGLWSDFIKEFYTFYMDDSLTNKNASKSIKHYVLEEAPNSFHSRITWDSVTKYMDDDTGIPKVKWAKSEIEKLHLKALACQRSVTPISTAPTMLNIPRENDISIDEPVVIEELKSPLSITTPEIPSFSTQNTVTTPISPTTSEKRSSIFGLSSLSRYLPHLSKSKLPSPTSPQSPTFNTPSKPRITVPNHNIVTSPRMNYMNVQEPVKETVSHLKRANTVAFSSPKPAKGTRTRPISSQSMDLLDLFDGDMTTPSNSSIPINFTPLVPIVSTSTPQQARQSTIPTNIHSDAKPSITASVHEEESFGDFPGKDITDNMSAFDVFSTYMVRSKTEPAVDTSASEPFDSFFQTPKTVDISVPKNTANDPFDSFFEKPVLLKNEGGGPYDRYSYFRKPTSPSNTTVNDDPFDGASYFKHTDIPPQHSTVNNDLLGIFSESIPQQPSKPPIPAHFDLLSPVYNQQQTTVKPSAKQELFDSFMMPSQINNSKPSVTAEDEDWGDWAF